uniref:Secreted protein n=1 Tax=Vitis vinifera TaxID=29760 RepID=F6HS95_VITVI
MKKISTLFLTFSLFLGDAWHRSYHPDVSHLEFYPANVPPYPDVSHPEFFSANLPPGCLTSGILLRQHSTQISHIRNSSPPTFHPDVSHPESFSADIPP